MALGTYLGVHNRENALLGHLVAGLQHGRSCLRVPAAGGRNGTVCLLPCHRWNYCHDDQVAHGRAVYPSFALQLRPACLVALARNQMYLVAC